MTSVKKAKVNKKCLTIVIQLTIQINRFLIQFTYQNILLIYNLIQLSNIPWAGHALSSDWSFTLNLHFLNLRPRTTEPDAFSQLMSISWQNHDIPSGLHGGEPTSNKTRDFFQFLRKLMLACRKTVCFFFHYKISSLRFWKINTIFKLRCLHDLKVINKKPSRLHFF